MRPKRKDEYAISSPMQLPYMKKLHSLLRLMGCWTYETSGVGAAPLPLRSNTFLFVVWVFLSAGLVHYCKRRHGTISFYELGQHYVIILMNGIAVFRITLPWTKNYQEATKAFVMELHLINHKHKSKYFMEMTNRVNRICGFFATFMHIQLYIGIFMFSVPTVISNYRAGMFSSHRPVNGTFEHSFSYDLPFIDIYTDLHAYIVFAMINVFIAHDCGSMFLVFDLFYSVIVFHVWGHLKILNYNLRNFPGPNVCNKIGRFDVMTYSADKEEKVKKKLVENIKHHVMIKEFVRKMSNAFGPMLGVYYLFHQIVGGILLLECTNLDTPSLMKYGTLTLIITQQLMQLSIVVETMVTQSESLKDAVYGVPWESMRPASRRAVRLFLLSVQEPLAINAMGIVSIGVRTMATIQKTCLSYFMLLRTLAQDE